MSAEDFHVYAMGLCNASVCTSLTDEQATARINETNPTGIARTWQLSDNSTFAGGDPHPCPCNEKPDTHRHLLFSC